MTEQPRLPSDVVEARLNHLIDRARRGALLPEEADQLATFVAELEAERDTYQADCRKWAGAVATSEKVRRLHAADADRYEAQLRARVAELETEVTRLTAGQCVDSRRMCEQHHHQPVTGCPYPRCLTAREQPTTA